MRNSSSRKKLVALFGLSLFALTFAMVGTGDASPAGKKSENRGYLLIQKEDSIDVEDSNCVWPERELTYKITVTNQNEVKDTYVKDGVVITDEIPNGTVMTGWGDEDQQGHCQDVCSWDTPFPERCNIFRKTLPSGFGFKGATAVKWWIRELKKLTQCWVEFKVKVKEKEKLGPRTSICNEAKVKAKFNIGVGGNTTLITEAGVDREITRLCTNPSLLSIPFNASAEFEIVGWITVDEGTEQGPSDWFINGPSIQQASNIFDGVFGGASLEKMGTYAYPKDGDFGWTDYVLTTSLWSQDDDVIGLMFRFTDSDNYYRFSMSSQYGYRRLTKTVAGVTTLLAEDNIGYTPFTWYDVEIEVMGDSIEVYMDDMINPIFAVTDSDLTQGNIALYTWANGGGAFGPIKVESP